jgi:hypothetical protein
VLPEIDCHAAIDIACFTIELIEAYAQQPIVLLPVRQGVAWRTSG